MKPVITTATVTRAASKIVKSPTKSATAEEREGVVAPPAALTVQELQPALFLIAAIMVMSPLNTSHFTMNASPLGGLLTTAAEK